MSCVRVWLLVLDHEFTVSQIESSNAGQDGIMPGIGNLHLSQSRPMAAHHEIGQSQIMPTKHQRSAKSVSMHGTTWKTGQSQRGMQMHAEM